LVVVIFGFGISSQVIRKEDQFFAPVLLGRSSPKWPIICGVGRWTLPYL